jgi:UDP-glucose 4-epimerase
VRVLVTGGAGFIGSHLVDALLASGDEVTVVDRLVRGHDNNLSAASAAGVTVVRADVTEAATMTAAVGAARPEVIHHLAGQINARRSVDDPSFDTHVNVGGTAAVLEAAHRAGVRRLVFASTAGVYGDPSVLPAREDTPLAPLSPYGASKAAAETYLELFARLRGISTLSLRMANVYGPRQNPDTEAGIVAILCRARAASQPATIFGDGLQTRDYVYVDDVVAAFMAAGRQDVQGALNVATGSETTLRRLVSEIGVATVAGDPRPGDVRRSCLNPSRAGEQLGWQARTPLADGLARTVAAMSDGASQACGRSPSTRRRANRLACV